MGSARASSNLVVVVFFLDGGSGKNLTRGRLSSVRVAQWIARLPPKEKVVGSTPTSDMFPFFWAVALCLASRQQLRCNFQKKLKKNFRFYRDLNSDSQDQNLMC
jgi:hypothetical protein